MGIIRILLIEELGLVRQGIRAVLAAESDLAIVGEVSDAEEAARAIRSLSPDVVLMDQSLIENAGLDTIRQIKQATSEVEFVIMASRLDDAKALQAIEAGAMGYILKDIPGPNLAAAIRAVCTGRAFLHPAMVRKLVDHLVRVVRQQHARGRGPSIGLTPRELGILVEVAKGRTDQEIASTFVVTPGTVKTHIRHVLRKLSVRNRAQAVAHVLRKGLIQ